MLTNCKYSPIWSSQYNYGSSIELPGPAQIFFFPLSQNLAGTCRQMRGQGLLLQNQHYLSLWVMKIMLFLWNVWVCIPERKSSLDAPEALSYTIEESQENTYVICTFHQHFKHLEEVWKMRWPALSCFIWLTCGKTNEPVFVHLFLKSISL